MTNQNTDGRKENRTSDLIKRIADMEARGVQWTSRVTHKDMQAIAAKYKKMEEALQEIGFDGPSWHSQKAEQALAFDLLSSPPPHEEH